MSEGQLVGIMMVLERYGPIIQKCPDGPSMAAMLVDHYDQTIESGRLLHAIRSMLLLCIFDVPELQAAAGPLGSRSSKGKLSGPFTLVQCLF